MDMNVFKILRADVNAIYGVQLGGDRIRFLVEVRTAGIKSAGMGVRIHQPRGSDHPGGINYLGAIGGGQIGADSGDDSVLHQNVSFFRCIVGLHRIDESIFNQQHITLPPF